MRFKFTWVLSIIIFLSACQSHFTIEGRRYTKGLYVSFLHKTTDYFKKNFSPKRSSANAPAKLTLTQNQAGLSESIEAKKLVSYNPITSPRPQKPLLQLKSLTHTSAAQKLKTTKQNFKIKFYKPISTEGKGLKIFKIILLSIINLWIGLIGYGLLLNDFYKIAIPLLILFAYLFYEISKIIKSINAKTSHDTNAYNDEPGNDATTEIIKSDYGKGLVVLMIFLKILKWIFLILSPMYFIVSGIFLVDILLESGDDLLFVNALLIFIGSLIGLLISYGLHKCIIRINTILIKKWQKNKINTIRKLILRN